MRALSLTQPWATLVAIGAKTIETRSWATGYRGPLAIHATRETPRWSENDEVRDEIDAVLARAGYETSEGLPSGAGAILLPRSSVLCVCDLLGVFRTESMCKLDSRGEELFGDFSPGRFGWLLGLLTVFVPPVPARGRQGLWAPDPELKAKLHAAPVVGP